MGELIFTAEQWDEVESIIASTVASVLREQRVRGQERREVIATTCARQAYHFRAEGVHVAAPY